MAYIHFYVQINKCPGCCSQKLRFFENCNKCLEMLELDSEVVSKQPVGLSEMV